MTSNGSPLRWLEVVLALLLGGVVIAELLVYNPSIQRSAHPLAVSARLVQSGPQSTDFDIQIAHDSAADNLRLVAFPLLGGLHQRSIYVYYDAGYPTASVNASAAQGLFDNLAGELLIHRYAQPVVTVSSTGLVDVLNAVNRASERTIVMMSGVLPAEVFSRRIDLLTGWVNAGGLVVSGGATIGYYSGLKGTPLTDSMRLSYEETGPDLVLGKGLATFPWVTQRTATAQSDFGSALGITYAFDAAGIKAGMALARGGRILGWTSGQVSSVTYLPVGPGGYLVFGGEILDAGAVAKDLAQILLSGAVYSSGPVATKELHLANIAPSSILHWNLPFTITNAGIMFVAFDPNPDSVFYYQQVIV